MNPDLAWYTAQSKEKGLAARCPHASAQRCHRYFSSISLLSEEGMISRLEKSLHDTLLNKWRASDLWPVTDEGGTSISGCNNSPSCFTNFCPEVLYSFFKIFASTVIHFADDIDAENRRTALVAKGFLSTEFDWRWHFEHVDPMHYSQCPAYSQIGLDGRNMNNVTINGNISGQLNIAGTSIHSPALHITLAELLTRIESADAPPEAKEDAKSKLKDFLSHPIVAALVGGLAGSIGA